MAIPDPVRASDLDEILEDLADQLEPCSVPEFARAMDRLFEFARAFGIRDFDAAVVVKLYRQALPGIPEKPLNAAIDTAIATWKWPTLPKPADLREMAEPLWYSSRAARDRVWTASHALSRRPAE